MAKTYKKKAPASKKVTKADKPKASKILIVGNPNMFGINQFHSKHNGMLKTKPISKKLNKAIIPSFTTSQYIPISNNFIGLPNHHLKSSVSFCTSVP